MLQINDMILPRLLTVRFLTAFEHCPMPCAMILRQLIFQFVNACFLLNVGGLALCLIFQERGPHSQGTKTLNAVHANGMQHWMATERPCRNLVCESSLAYCM